MDFVVKKHNILTAITATTIKQLSRSLQVCPFVLIVYLTAEIIKSRCLSTLLPLVHLTITSSLLPFFLKVLFLIYNGK